MTGKVPLVADYCNKRKTQMTLENIRNQRRKQNMEKKRREKRLTSYVLRSRQKKIYIYWEKKETSHSWCSIQCMYIIYMYIYIYNMYITFNIYTQEKKKTHLLLPFFFSGTCFVLYFFVIFFHSFPKKKRFPLTKHTVLQRCSRLQAVRGVKSNQWLPSHTTTGQ